MDTASHSWIQWVLRSGSMITTTSLITQKHSKGLRDASKEISLQNQVGLLSNFINSFTIKSVVHYMDNVFIDTNIFEKENFLEGHRIKSILDLGSKGKVQIVLSKITLYEIKSRFKKRAEEALIKHNELINDKEIIIAPLRNLSEADKILKKFPHIKIVCEEFNQKLDEAMKVANAVFLEYPTINIGDVFDKYFQGKFPFSSGDKKREFPDAFAIAHIEQWCDEHKTTCTVFSKDKDFLKTHGKRIIVRNDYEQLFINYLSIQQPTRLELLRRTYEDNRSKIACDINEWLDDQLNDENIYTDVTNWLDIHSLSVTKKDVTLIGYEVVGVYDEKIEISVNAKVSFNVCLTIDDENTGFWDNEDKVMLFREQADMEVERKDVDISAVINFDIINHDEYDDSYNVIEINEGKNLEIDDNRWD